MKTLVIDTETTGLDPSEDEILQLAILDGDGSVLYNKYLRPEKVTSWPGAQLVNGITPEMVKDAPTFREELPEIQAILNGANLIICYNVGFDIPFLQWAGCDLPEWGEPYPPKCAYEDVMEYFAAIYGDFNPFYGSYTWKKLSVAAEWYGYDWGKDKVHDALADCRATLHIWDKMLESGDRIIAERLIYEAAVDS